MARIRTIKPEFWVDEKIVELSAFARLLFIGLWNFVDDEGRMVCSKNKIKMQIFPADSLDISELIGEIRGKLLIDIYVIDNVEILQINGFCKHQKIDRRTKSKLPSKHFPANSPRCSPTDQGRDQGRDQGVSKNPKSKKPTLLEVREYCIERLNKIDPERFFNHYEANGWVQGKNKPIKNWKAAVITWEKNAFDHGGKKQDSTPGLKEYSP